MRGSSLQEQTSRAAGARSRRAAAAHRGRALAFGALAAAAVACHHAAPSGRAPSPAWSPDLPDCRSADECVRLGDAVRRNAGPDFAAVARAHDEKACQLGGAGACARIGASYATDLGVPKDEARAVTFLRRACELGEPSACLHGATLLSTSPIEPGGAGWDLLLRGCDLGEAAACHYVGVTELMKGGAEGARRAAGMLERGCALGNGSACRAAGAQLAGGLGVARDDEAGAAFLQRGCDLGDGTSCHALATLVAGGEGPTRANELFEKACDAGHASSCTTLGMSHYRGRGVDRDLARASALHGRACALGDAQGCYNLGYAFGRGEGVAQDWDRANELFARACESDHAVSCNDWGVSFARGFGTPVDQERANRLYGKACELGDGVGCSNLGLSHARASAVPQDWARANALFAKGCELGAGRACVELGASAENGTGAPRDQERANALYERACGLDHGGGCNALALSYAYGKGLPADRARANALFERACDLRDGEGCADLGYAAATGLGIPQDWQRANALYSKACELGSGLGCSNLGFSHEAGTGVPRDLRRAAELYDRGCGLGSAKACSNLGNSFLDGLGVTQDARRGIELHERACSLDGMQGCYVLGLAYAEGFAVPADPRRAHELHAKACRLGEPAACAALAARAAESPERAEVAARALASVASATPSQLSGVSEDAVFRIAAAATRLLRGNDARFELLSALFRARWDPDDASDLWAELALALLERGLRDAAADVIPRVTDPFVVAALRVDARCAALVSSRPEGFDVDAALARETSRRRAAVERAPRSLRALGALLSSLVTAAQYDEVLRLSGETLLRARAAGAPYDDADEQLPWVMNARGRALWALGRWQEAADQYAEAVRASRERAPNVGHAINLAGLYTSLDRPKEALELVQGLDERVSPYGRMQIERVRVVAGVALGDDAAAGRALSYLRAHRADSDGALQFALVAADRLDEAASMLVDRLADPARRLDALRAVQQFIEPPSTPRGEEWRARWNGVLARPEVRRAIAAVGRVERFRLVDD